MRTKAPTELFVNWYAPSDCIPRATEASALDATIPEVIRQCIRAGAELDANGGQDG